MEQNKENLSNLADRIKQIRSLFCFNSNTEFAKKINKSTHFSSQLCTGASNPGKGILEEILAAFPEVSRSWLYFGEGDMLKAAPKPYESDMERKSPRVDEEPAVEPSNAYLRRENERLWERYDEAQQTIGSLRTQLSQLREKLNSVSEKIPSETTFA